MSHMRDVERSFTDWPVVVWAKTVAFRRFTLVLVILALVGWSGSFSHADQGVRKSLVFGSDRDYPPFEWLDKDGQPQGFTVDLIRAIGEAMGYEVEVRLGPWAEMREEFEVKRTTDVADLYFAEERTGAFDFTKPFWVVHQEIFVRRGTTGIATLADLAGKEVVCQAKAFVSERLAQEAPTAKVIPADSEPAALRLLASGQHDCAIVTRLVGRYAIVQHDLRNLTTAGPPLWHRDYCFVTLKGRLELLADLNQGLAILRETGRFDEMYDKWFAERLPREPWKDALLRGLPWLLFGLTGLAAVVATWILTLQQQLRKRTRHLREELAARGRAEETLAADLRAASLLQVLAATFVREGGLQPVLDKAVETAIALAEADMGNIQLLDPQSGFLKIGAQRGFEQAWLNFWDEVGEGQGACGTAMQRGERVIVDDVAGDPIFLGTPALDVQLGAGVRAVVSTPLVAPDGRCVGMISVHFKKPGRPEEHVLRQMDLLARLLADIVRYAQHESALRRSEEKLSEALEMAHAGHWEYDVASDTFTFNDNFYRIFHTTAAEVGGYEMSSAGYARKFCHPDDIHMVGEETRAVIASTDPDYSRQVEHRILYADGQTGWMSVRFSIVKDSQGRTVKTYGVNQNITERKRAEEEREQLLGQLLQSQKLESLGILAGGVAHEINNPIMGIMGYAQLIKDKLPPENELTEYAVEIGKEAERVAGIVRSLLSFARVEKQSHSPARLCDIVEGTLSLARAVLRHDQVAVAVDVPEDLPKLKCRTQQLQQVVMNLVTNARDALNAKYAEYHEDKTISIRGQGVERDGKPWLRLTVEDHGSGIPEAVRQHMFEPFYTTKPRDKGTGLGLSVSYGIVRDHHGEITVESEPGEWTRFHVELPVDNGWGLETGAET